MTFHFPSSRARVPATVIPVPARVVAPQAAPQVTSQVAPPKPRRDDRQIAIVQLGRRGDILNILPVAEDIFKTTGVRPLIAVHESMADILDHVSYVEPYLWTGTMEEVQRCAKLLAGQNYEVRIPQLWGDAEGRGPDFSSLTSYDSEQWLRLGYGNQLGMLPLHIDKRDREEEQRLIDGLKLDPAVPLVVYGMAGTSSPFAQAQPFLVSLALMLQGRCRMVDLNQVGAKSVMDLLGLIEKASVLLTIDTVYLHLATACQTPVIALLNDTIWHGTQARCNLKLAIRYKEAISRLNEICATTMRCFVSPGLGRPSRAAKKAPKFYHVVALYNCHNPDEERRCRFASKTWEHFYEKGLWIPAHKWNYRRTSAYIDPKLALPFHKDVWADAVANASDDNDVIIYTNYDTVFLPEVQDLVEEMLKKRDAFCGFRDDYGPGPIKSIDDLPSMPTKPSYGRDIFVWRVRWLIEHWHMIPDTIMGTSEWDYYLAAYYRWLAGCKLRMSDMCQVNPEVEIPRGTIFHEKHPENRYANRDKWKLVEDYSIGNVTRFMRRIGNPRMHLCS